MWGEFIGYVANHAGTLIAVGTSLVGGFALIATLTPNKVDDRIGQILADVVNFLGANWGKAKNKE